MDIASPHSVPDVRTDRLPAAEKSAIYRSFWRKLDAALSAIEAATDLTTTLDTILRILLQDFRQELKFVAGRLIRDALHAEQGEQLAHERR